MRRLKSATPLKVRSGKISKLLDDQKKTRHSSSKLFAIWSDVVSRSNDIFSDNADDSPLQLELCAKCQRIDFDSLFEGPRFPETPPPQPIEVGSFLSVHSQTSARCPFCRLLKRALASFGTIAQGDPQELICYIAPWRADRAEEGFQLDEDTDKVTSQLMVEFRRDKASMPNSDLAQNIVWLDQPKDSPRLLLSGVYLRNLIDSTVIKNWIRDCETCHDATCGSSADLHCPYLPSNFAAIDVHKYQPTLPMNSLRHCNHQETRYVALSYVWEQGVRTFRDYREFRKHSARQSGKSSSSTITDAVEVCKRLGERYLWVDSVCVSQDPIERKHQISQMDSIYSHAVFTIVAALDRDSSPGLPGVYSEREQKAQRHETELVHGKILTLSKPSLTSYLSRSTWKTRGWTHQEGVLSRRCLIFTDDEVFWCCHRSLKRESLGNVPASSRLPTLSAFESASDNITSRDLGSKWEYLTFGRLLGEFTKRKFTLESDALPAFNGLANLLSRRFGIQFLNGLPLCNFITGLCWFGSSRLARRTQFPSWSWAGWNGEIRQDYYLVHTPLENNKTATLAKVEPLPGGKYLRVTSQIAQIQLSHRLDSENEPRYFPRGATALMPSYLSRPLGRSFFLMSVPTKFDMKQYQSTYGTCEFLMLARLCDSNFIKLTKMDLPSLRPEYVLALFIDRSGNHARRIGLLAIPAKLWDDASLQPAVVVVE